VARNSAALLLAALAASCAEVYYLDLPDINLDPPADLAERLARYRSGEERWHGDPRAVADVTLRQHLDVPWKAEPFRPSVYEFKESPEWGPYVVRGYTYPSGHVMRYRVKLRRYEEIWYPVQVSRYKIQEVPDEDPAHGPPSGRPKH
jgi:hypothetical protein